MFISLKFLRLYDRVLADSFPQIPYSVLWDRCFLKTIPNQKNSVDSIAPEKGFLFSVSTLFFVLSVQSNVTCDLRGNKRQTRRLCAFPRKVHALVGIILLIAEYL